MDGLFRDRASRLAGACTLLFGWTPEAFWRATPAELATVLGAMGGEGEGISSPELARLMEAFPDG